MIYTITLNPSLDYVATLNSPLTIGEVNRARGERFYPGGKGINVSIVLNRLGLATQALGFTAGFTGDEIKRLLDGCGCPHDFIAAGEGVSRISVKLTQGGETQINGGGPVITHNHIMALCEKLVHQCGIGPQDTVVLAGSVPEHTPADACEQVLAAVSARGADIVADMTGKHLTHALAYAPLLIKPNLSELCEVFDCAISGQAILSYARRLQKQGARNVLVSMGADGAILLCEDGSAYRAFSPKVQAVCTVGAGDSMVAGFLAGYGQKRDAREALALAVAAGTATAAAPWLCEREELLRLVDEVVIQGVQ